MQGQRDGIGSLPETIDFDHGSASSNANIDLQICWNNLRNPVGDLLPDTTLPPSDTNINHLNSVGYEGTNLSRWSLDESRSSNSPNEIFCCDEPKRVHGWSSPLLASAGAGQRLEERYEPTDFLSMHNVNLNFHRDEIANGHFLFQTPRFDATTPNIDINPRLSAHGGDDCQVIDRPNSYKSGKSLDKRIQSASSSSDPFGSHSRYARRSVEENDARPDHSLQGRRLSCKRKVLEGVVGQSSVEGSSTFQPLHAVSAKDNAGSSLSISTLSDSAPSDQVIVRTGVVAGMSFDRPSSISVPGIAESFQRNSRMRLNPSHHEDSLPLNLTSLEIDNINGHINISSPSPSPGLLPVNHMPDLGSARSGDSESSQDQPFVVCVPPLPRNGHSFRWNGASSSRPGSLSSPVISGVRDSMLHEEPNSGNMPRNITEHPMFIPMTELTNSAQNSTNWNLTGRNTSIPGSVSSTSRAGSRSSINSSSASNWVPHRIPSSHYPRRLSELFHRSLLQSSIGSESGGQASNYPPLHSVPSFVAGYQGSYQSYARSAMLLDRQGDGVLGIPYPLRNLSTASDGTHMLVAEIRNVLDLVRRGEGLRFEDHAMIFDRLAFYGASDTHDRYGDMRLDVDNMSYEELLALEERIGNVSTGLSEETITKHLKQHKYSCYTPAMEPCCICQEDYCDGDDLGTLDCGHGFHTGCVKQWLMHKNLCPICKLMALRNQ